MRQTIKIPFGSYYKEKFSKPIRNKKDIVLFIFDAVDALLVRVSGEECGVLWIKKEKMSRIFCFLDEKYFSLVFPFEVELIRENEFKIYDSFFEIEIDNRKIVLLRRILDEIDFMGNSIESIIEDAYLDVAENGYEHEEIEQCFMLILRLLSMELGYIRYDYDPEHENGKFHPLHHLDINYSSKGTYKLGMNNKIQINDFVDLLDVKKECRYIKE